ncbi:hypothetical protein [[Clostridium] polysaccharolyticum]|uniref:Uncharacterized protein n=1 Tax=[Clostridium] polysaccharolyticum TaxID=29364 RepID=A0A1H9Y7Y2_9FIRM|nr:hypothetical protein [[Clostridium] polysaccharolyticum]SES64900.1 hypothetical protein SAMN04487772_101199 [[Clostridium] polysaccharolyticum]
MCGHSEKCIYKGKNMLYALLEIEDNHILLAASEMPLFYTYLKYASEDKSLKINYDEADNEQYQLVYGSVLVNPLYEFDYKELVEVVDKMKGNALLELIDENEIRVSAYDDIFMLQNGKTEGNYPFVALMKTKSTFVPNYSCTMFPSIKGYQVWESLVNRKFLLACRYATKPVGLTIEKWKNYISQETMLSINEIADIYTGEVLGDT